MIFFSPYCDQCATLSKLLTNYNFCCSLGEQSFNETVINIVQHIYIYIYIYTYFLDILLSSDRTLSTLTVCWPQPVKKFVVEYTNYTCSMKERRY